MEIYYTAHLIHPIVVDDFGVKYKNRGEVDHLIGSLKKYYELTEDWDGNLYCGIKLK